MRKFFLAAVMAATSLSAIPATAQDYRGDRQDQRGDDRGDRRDDRADRRDDRRDYRQDARQDWRQDRLQDARQRNWQQYRGYDYNRFEPGQRTYLADRYYRDGSYYQPRRLGRNDRIYRGGDNRYYCRRSDGTTGLIIGGLAGGLLGNSLASGGSRTLGTLIGGGAGALLGQSVDRGQVQCR
ncbi:glycine zipper 2TM domain-containing protein [Sphingomonas glacialis]|uniref:17 kDa surface antigen n=1 Tax=Sphingomonas glacialis TaxID=658225 RepID=A0A502G013_9SPHN|nr:glycine zipper 2TM domain-containing protein [Sphingomonas glacialis]TPG55114.1 glycine zipper 2TM domain-containing protein [Sphingomonas glacialis]